MPPRAAKKVTIDVPLSQEEIEKRNVYSYAKKAMNRDINKLKKRIDKLQDMITNNQQYLDSYAAEIRDANAELEKLTKFNDVL